MAFNNIANNRYSFPAGYRHGVSAPYKPWNGLITSLNSPGVSITGAIFNMSVDAVPPDLSRLQLYGDDGAGTYDFQFTYGATGPTGGTINIPLIEGGGSAAQAADAIANVLGQASGVKVGTGEVIQYRWQLQKIGQQIRLYYTEAGAEAVGGYNMPAGVVGSTIALQGLALDSVAPGRVGMFGTFLPG